MIPRSARERRVFTNSSAYLAVIDRRDEHHQDALDITSRLINGGYRLFTTNSVIIEAHALILSSLGIERATTFLHDAETSRIITIRTRAADEELAKQLIFRHQDKRFSFTDAISFVVMERLAIRHAFAFDRNFAQYGFPVLRADQL